LTAGQADRDITRLTERECVYQGNSNGSAVTRRIIHGINGVLEYLTKDGYSTIICRDDRNVFLENGSGQKTLDLRYYHYSSTRDCV